MKKEDLIKEWERYAIDFLNLARMGESAPLSYEQLHIAAREQRGRGETFAECAKQLKEIIN